MYVSFNTRDIRCSGLPWLLLGSLNTTSLHVCPECVYIYANTCMYSLNTRDNRCNGLPVLLQGFRHTTRINVYTYVIIRMHLSICENIVGIDYQCYCWASDILHEWMCTRMWIHVCIFQYMRPSLEWAASAAAGLATYYTNECVYVNEYLYISFSVRDNRCNRLPVLLLGFWHTIGWPRWVGSLQLYVSFAEYSLFYRSLLQNIVSFIGLFYRALLQKRVVEWEWSWDLWSG